MSPFKKSETSASTSKRRGRKPRIPRANSPPPRRDLRALAILASAAAVHAGQGALVNQPPQLPPIVPDIVPGNALNANAMVEQHDLNIPPPEALEQQHLPEQLPAVDPLMQPGPARLGIPFYFSMQQAQGFGGLPNNFNGGVPSYNIRVRSTNLHDHGVAYSIAANETMFRIYMDYAARVDLGVTQIIIKRFDVVVPSMGTAFGAGIQDGDVLSVEPVNMEHNVDTRFKHFTVQDLSAAPREIKVYALPHATLYGAYEMWGAKYNVDVGNLVGFHENAVITNLHTVTEAGIKNQDRLYVLPNNWREVREV